MHNENSFIPNSQETVIAFRHNYLTIALDPHQTCARNVRHRFDLLFRLPHYRSILIFHDSLNAHSIDTLSNIFPLYLFKIYSSPKITIFQFFANPDIIFHQFSNLTLLYVSKEIVKRSNSFSRNIIANKTLPSLLPLKKIHKIYNYK